MDFNTIKAYFHQVYVATANAVTTSLSKADELTGHVVSKTFETVSSHAPTVDQEKKAQAPGERKIDTISLNPDEVEHELMELAGAVAILKKENSLHGEKAEHELMELAGNVAVLKRTTELQGEEINKLKNQLGEVTKERDAAQGTSKTLQQKVDQFATKQLKAPPVTQGVEGSTSSEREEQLMQLLRMLADKVKIEAREPYKYSAEELALPFIEEAIGPLLEAEGAWVANKTKTQAGTTPIETLKSLGIITAEAQSKGPVVYHAKPLLEKDRPIEFLRQKLLTWIADKPDLIIDAAQAEGFLDLQSGSGNLKLEKYINGKSADSRKAGEELGLPDSNALLAAAYDLACLKGVQVANTRANELFENPADSVQVAKQAKGEYGDFAALAGKRNEIVKGAAEGKDKLEKYYTEQESKVEETRQMQSMIAKVLGGGAVSGMQAAAPPPPPPPPPPVQSHTPPEIKKE